MEYADILLIIKERLLQNLPKGQNPAQELSHILHVTPRTVNRKLSGSTQFSLTDIIRIAECFTLSPNDLLGHPPSIFSHPMELMPLQNIAEYSKYKYVVETTYNLFRQAGESPNSKCMSVCRYFPNIVYQYYEWMAKFSHLKWIYFNKSLSDILPLREMTYLYKNKSMQNAYGQSVVAIKKLIFILDNDIIRNYTRELLFFHNMEYLSRDEVNYILEDTSHLITAVENICKQGYLPSTGNELAVYYSDISLYNDLYLIKSDNIDFVILYAQGYNPILTKDFQTLELVRKWVDSWLRCSHPISSTAENDRRDFFRNQRNVLEEFRNTYNF